MDAVKLAIILFAVGALIYRKFPLGIALATGTAVTGILYGVPAKTWLNVPYAAAMSVSNLHLLAALYFIMVFENILRNKGVMKRLLDDCSAVLPDVRSVLVVIPAFIGLLPSLGGALFSAPLVKQAATQLQLSKEQEFNINYWFRHVWEYFLPIIPCVLLAATILSIPPREFVVHFFYLAILMFVVGFLFLVRPIPAQKREIPFAPGERQKYLKDLFFVLSPIIVILVLVIFAHWHVTWAALLVVAALFIYYRYSMVEIKNSLAAAFERRIFYLVGGVLLFKEMMIQSGAVAAIVDSFVSLGIPGVLMLGTLSLLLGFMTGMTQGAVGMAFPLILSFPEDARLPLAMVALGCAIAGQMLSPMHLCLAVTQEYFGSSYVKSIPKIAVMEAVMVAVMFVVYYFWQY